MKWKRSYRFVVRLEVSSKSNVILTRRSAPQPPQQWGPQVGELKKKRLIFRTEGATYADVRDAIASHRKDAGGDGVVPAGVLRGVSVAL